jgi:hypothetical protein
MISVINAKWNTKDGLRGIIETNPGHVHIEGKMLPENTEWSGYVNTIPYSKTIMVKHGGKTYGFKKATDNTVKVL